MVAKVISELKSVSELKIFPETGPHQIIYSPLHLLSVQVCSSGSKRNPVGQAQEYDCLFGRQRCEQFPFTTPHLFSSGKLRFNERRSRILT